MTQKEREYIIRIVNYFDYHNKNLTKTQDWQIYKLKELVNGNFTQED